MPRHKRASGSPLNFLSFAKRTSNGQIPIVTGIATRNSRLSKRLAGLKKSSSPANCRRMACGGRGNNGRQSPPRHGRHRLTPLSELGANRHQQRRIFRVSQADAFSEFGIHALLVAAIADGEQGRPWLGARGRLGARAFNGSRRIAGFRTVAEPDANSDADSDPNADAVTKPHADPNGDANQLRYFDGLYRAEPRQQLPGAAGQPGHQRIRPRIRAPIRAAAVPRRRSTTARVTGPGASSTAFRPARARRLTSSATSGAPWAASRALARG